MLFKETGLPGAFVIELQPHADDRGFFARSFCAREFEEHGLKPPVAQCNLSYNLKKGTLRGMHFQQPPYSEAKLVRCVAGAIYDVIIDLRPESPAFGQSFGIELSAANRTALYIPEKFAHGFQTLADDTEVFYQMSEFYAPGFDRGYRYDDPAFKLVWPLPVSVISEKDLAWPAFSGPVQV